MAAYVALFRGIAPVNPKMRNAELRGVFEALGFADVRTVISSGNVVFSAPRTSAAKFEDKVEGALAQHLGAPCTTMIRTQAQIREVLESGVFDGIDEGPNARFNVTFLKGDPPTSAEVPADRPGGRVVAVAHRAVFTIADPGHNGAATMMRLVDKVYGTASTTRTWRTTRRISDAFATGPDPAQ